MPSKPVLSNPPRVLAIALTLLAALGGCSSKQEQTSTAAALPPAVIAVQVKREPVNEQSTYVGRVVAVDRVDLRARVSGFLKQRHFTEGQQVRAGDLLFTIEPDQYEATVEQAKADVAKAVAEEQNAKAQLNRGEELLKSKNISAAEVDKLRAAQSVAVASIAQAKAAQTKAELDLSYTRITAPVEGRIGLATYTIGNLVGPDSGPLATLVSRDPIYVQFPLTQREVLETRRDIEAKGGDPKDVVVRARLPDGSVYDRPGSLSFIDVTTNQGTDTVTIRAQLPNPDGLLIDGQYVGVLIEAGTPQTAILIPQSALQLDQQGTFVMVIDKDGKAEARRVVTGAEQGSRVAVQEGLKEGDLVIAEGVQKVRPGQEVVATPQAAVEASAEAPPASESGTATATGEGQGK